MTPPARYRSASAAMAASSSATRLASVGDAAEGDDRRAVQVALKLVLNSAPLSNLDDDQLGTEFGMGVCRRTVSAHDRHVFTAPEPMPGGGWCVMASSGETVHR